MKCNAAFLALAMLVATTTAAPTPDLEARGGIGSALSSVGSKISGGASSAGKGIKNNYNEHASTWNGALGTFPAVGALAAGGITAQTNEDKNAQNEQQQQQQPPAQRRALGRTNTGSSSNSGSSYHTANSNPPSRTSTTASTPAEEAKKATGGDKFGTFNNVVGNAGAGLAIWNAQQGYNQQQQAEQQPPAQKRALEDDLAKRMGWQVAADVGMMALMGGGGSVKHSDGSAQQSGNGNVRMGASKRDFDEPTLARRLMFSSDHQDYSSQSSGNGNMRIGAGNSEMKQQMMANMMSGGAQQQQKPASKRDLGHLEMAKRLVSSTHEDGSSQQSGNGNVRIGATSGDMFNSPAAMASLNAGSAMNYAGSH